MTDSTYNDGMPSPYIGGCPKYEAAHNKWYNEMDYRDRYEVMKDVPEEVKNKGRQAYLSACIEAVKEDVTEEEVAAVVEANKDFH